MSIMNKPRVVKSFEKLDDTIIAQIKLKYPHGFQNELILFTNKDGKYERALPFETDDRYYLIRMTKAEAKEIIEEDDDYNEDGNLKEDVAEELTEKYEVLDQVAAEEDDDD